MGPCDGERQSRGLALPLPCLCHPRARCQDLSPLLGAVGRLHTPLGWPWMSLVPSCHPRGVQGDDGPAAGVNPSKPARESRSPSREHREGPGQRPCGFWGAARSRIPLQANPPGSAPRTSRTPRNRGVPPRPHPRAVLGAQGREALPPQGSAPRRSWSEFLGRRRPGKAGTDPRPAPASSPASGTGSGHLSPRCRRLEDALSPGVPAHRGGGSFAVPKGLWELLGGGDSTLTSLGWPWGHRSVAAI